MIRGKKKLPTGRKNEKGYNKDQMPKFLTKVY